MSIVFSMTTMAVAIGISAVAGVGAATQLLTPLCDRSPQNHQELEPVVTRFADKETLTHTLTEHGFPVKEQADGVLVVETSVGSLRYYQPAPGQPFWVQPFDIKDEQELESRQQELIDEYMLNVQKSTYILLKQQIEQRDDLSLESEEFLEDETILLRINV